MEKTEYEQELVLIKDLAGAEDNEGLERHLVRD